MMARGKSHPPMYKVVVCGGGAVGKSAITIQFVQNRFVIDWDATIEDQYRKSCVVDGQETYLSVVDTAGQEAYRAMRPQYMAGADGFLLVYDVTSRLSFDEITEFWQEILRAKDADYFSRIVLVGNKCDLEYQRQVQTNEGRELARRIGCDFFETSAKHRLNVDESFYQVVRHIRRDKQKGSNGVVVTPSDAPTMTTEQLQQELAREQDTGCCVIA